MFDSSKTGTSDMRNRQNMPSYFNFIYCEFINIRWIPIFVDFVGTGEPRFKCSTKYKFFKGMNIDIAKTTKLNIHEYVSFPQTTKIGTHENK